MQRCWRSSRLRRRRPGGIVAVCCRAGHRDTDRYTGPWRATTSNPVLVVGNYFDDATPYEGAVTASRLLKNARLLSYAGWGHKAYLFAGNTCVDDKVNRYLVTNVLPTRGTVCQPERSPFDTARDVPLPLLLPSPAPE